MWGLVFRLVLLGKAHLCRLCPRLSQDRALSESRNLRPITSDNVINRDVHGVSILD